MLDAEALEADGAGGRPTIAGEGALMSALTAHRTGRMRDIVATLQAEQDAVVRAPLPGVLVVQGGPGTGKTAVALHRAAYLLYTHRDRIARSGVLVVGPSPVFLATSSRCCPRSGRPAWSWPPPGQLFPGVEATGTEPGRGRRPEGRPADGAAGPRRRPAAAADAEPSRSRWCWTATPAELTPRAVADARGRARQTGRPHNEARVTFVKHVLDDLAGQLAAVRGLQSDDEPTAELLDELRASRDVRREINLRWLPLTPQKLLADLFASPARLADGRRRAARPGRAATCWYASATRPGPPADVPLLDEAAELIGADVAGDTAQRAREARRAVRGAGVRPGRARRCPAMPRR